MSRAKILYESIGNEIFQDVILTLRQDTSAKEFRQGTGIGFYFSDGSSILFADGFASVSESPVIKPTRPIVKTFAEMNAINRRFFGVGMYVVAMFYVLVRPDETHRAVHRFISERLRDDQ